MKWAILIRNQWKDELHDKSADNPDDLSQQANKIKSLVFNMKKTI